MEIYGAYSIGWESEESEESERERERNRHPVSVLDLFAGLFFPLPPHIDYYFMNLTQLNCC